MQRISFHRLAVIIALLLALIVAVPISGAQEKSKPQPATAHKSASAKATEGRGGPQEGIQVHGHWVIEIRNPNGTLVDRVEFENALAPEGFFLLLRVLTSSAQPPVWSVAIGTAAGAGLCPSTASPILDLPVWRGDCVISQSSAQGLGLYGVPGVFKNLTVTANTDSANPAASSLILRGTATVEVGGIIDHVRTVAEVIPNGQDPNLANGQPYTFTSKALAPADQKMVVAGQIIQVSVAITFS